jgi:CBS domain containing-hemolysin-like protein
MDLAAGVPEVGDRVESEHYRFLVVAMDGRRIEEVEISLRVDEDDE